MKKDIRVEGNAPGLKELIRGATAPKQYWHCWDTPESLAAFLESTPPSYDEKLWLCTNRDFYGTRDMQEAISLARGGWPEGAKRAAALRDRINAANPTGPRVVRWDVAGAVASVPRALAGNPLAMRRVDTAKLRRRPVMTLVSDMSTHCGIAGASLANRAAVVAAIVDAIEAAGYSAHVIGFACGDSRSDYAQRDFLAATVVTLKEPSHAADIGRLAFGLGHPAMLRRFAFATWTLEPSWSEKYVGTHAAYPFSLCEHDAAESVFTLPGLNNDESKFATEAAAETAGLRFFIGELQRQGCPAFPAVDARAA